MKPIIITPLQVALLMEYMEGKDKKLYPISRVAFCRPYKDQQNIRMSRIIQEIQKSSRKS